MELLKIVNNISRYLNTFHILILSYQGMNSTLSINRQISSYVKQFIKLTLKMFCLETSDKIIRNVIISNAMLISFMYILNSSKQFVRCSYGVYQEKPLYWVGAVEVEIHNKTLIWYFLQHSGNQVDTLKHYLSWFGGIILFLLLSNYWLNE